MRLPKTLVIGQHFPLVLSFIACLKDIWPSSCHIVIFTGKPIQCWTPQEFTRSWEEYAENYCWVASTYFVHLNGYPGPPPPHIYFHRELPAGSVIANGPGTGGSSPGNFMFPTANRGPNSHQNLYPGIYQAKAGERPAPGRLISYYQWAPILLAIQSFLFYLPCLIWRLFSSQSGFHVSYASVQIVWWQNVVRQNVHLPVCYDVLVKISVPETETFLGLRSTKTTRIAFLGQWSQIFKKFGRSIFDIRKNYPTVKSPWSKHRCKDEFTYMEHSIVMGIMVALFTASQNNHKTIFFFLKCPAQLWFF